VGGVWYAAGADGRPVDDDDLDDDGDDGGDATTSTAGATSPY
jgi:hypothetical protein